MSTKKDAEDPRVNKAVTFFKTHLTITVPMAMKFANFTNECSGWAWRWCLVSRGNSFLRGGGGAYFGPKQGTPAATKQWSAMEHFWLLQSGSQAKKAVGEAGTLGVGSWQSAKGAP